MPEFVFDLPVVGGSSSTEESILPDGTIDHELGAIDRLPQQFKNDEVYRIFRCLNSGKPALEKAINDVLLSTLETAVGVLLADIGALVGQPNLDFPDDDTYRRYIKARIIANKSSGLTNQLIKICRLLVDDDDLVPTLQRYGHASVMVQLAGLIVSTDLATVVLGFMRDSVGGGIRVVVTYSTSAPAVTFTLDDGPGLDDGHLLGSIE